MTSIGEAFRYPLEGDDVATVFILCSGLLIAAAAIYFVGLVLSFVFVGIFVMPFAIVPIVFLYGYFVRVLRTTIEGEEGLPSFEDWGALGMDGGRAIVAAIAYQLPAYVLLMGGVILTVGLEAVAGSGPGEAASVLMGGAFLVVGLLTLGYFLAVAYVLPAALCSMAEDGRINGAFDFGRIKNACLSADYAIGWLVAAVVGVLLNPIASAFTLLLVGFPLLIYLYLVLARLVGDGYRESRSA